MKSHLEMLHCEEDRKQGRRDLRRKMKTAHLNVHHYLELISVCIIKRHRIIATPNVETSFVRFFFFFSITLCMLVHVGRQIVEMCASSTSKCWKRHTHIVCLFFFWQTEKLISTLSQGALGKAWKGRVRVYDAIACMMFARTFQRGVKGAC